MMRALFLALGISTLLLGLECLVIEKAELAGAQSNSVAGISARAMPGSREVTPPEGAPWILMSAGAVVILYTFTIPKKMSG